MVSFLFALAFFAPVHALSGFIKSAAYISDWIPIDYTVNGGWPESTSVAQQEIVAAAQSLAQQGPWTVTSKTILPPDGDIHTYLSWSPYWWPDCSNVKNTTVLTDQQIYTDCNYVQRDGQFNPDRSLINDTGGFYFMSDAIFFNTLAYKITGDATYSQNVAHWIDTWFLNPETYMNPNLRYSQVIRGANHPKTGAHEGVLDLHCMTKVVSAIIVLKRTGAAAWTQTLEDGMVAWGKKYIEWLAKDPSALDEKATPNNHGSFYFSQLAAIQIMVGDLAGANTTIGEYYNGIYQAQIDATGEQPFEADRAHPYHYRAYNGGAIITINRIADYLGWADAWNTKTAAGATLQTAIDFAMTTKADEGPTELYPNVAAVASHYGDPNGTYAAWLAKMDAVYPGEAWFFWNQPLSDSNIKVSLDSQGSLVKGTGGGGVTATGTSSVVSFPSATSAASGVLASTLGVTFIVGLVGLLVL